MKIIFSRKGFDSSNGGMASPIMPDGTMLSLPIPAPGTLHTFESLKWGDMSYYDIIKSLKPSTGLQPTSCCHLDPDIREDICHRKGIWQPAFGQACSSLSELRNNDVTVGDLFMFFGWFRQTEFFNGKLRYTPGAPDIQAFYGYMQIGVIIERKEELPESLAEHPHAGYGGLWAKRQNAIYLPTDTLSLLPERKGYGLLDIRQDRVLTKDGYSRTRWNLPDFFKKVSISHNPKPWKNGYFQSASIGQEFIMEAIPEIQNWAKGILA